MNKKTRIHFVQKHMSLTGTKPASVSQALWCC